MANKALSFDCFIYFVGVMLAEGYNVRAFGGHCAGDYMKQVYASMQNR